jgi:hypothetical protein
MAHGVLIFDHYEWKDTELQRPKLGADALTDLNRESKLYTMK